jgi:hypothetical protein
MLTLPIRKELFWDIDFQLMDEKKNKQIIIERVISLGNLLEFKAIEKYYGHRLIKNTLSKIGYFDPKTLEFVLSYFHLKPGNLKCYTRRQLHQQYWN